MPITFRAATDNYVNSNNLSITRPAVVENGDVLVAIVTQNRDNATMATPTGWSVYSDDRWDTHPRHIAWRVVVDTGAEPSSYVWSSTNSYHFWGAILAYSGVDTATPFDLVSPVTNQNTATLSPITTVTDGARRIAAGMVSTSGAGGVSNAPAGMVFRAAAGNGYFTVVDEDIHTAGATSARTWQGGLSSGFLSIQTALRPATDAPAAVTTGRSFLVGD